MKSFGFASVAILATQALSMIGATPASAVKVCAQAQEINSKPGGSWGNSRCTEGEAALKAYVLYSRWRAIQGGWCVHDIESTRALLPYENEMCTMLSAPADTGRYTKLPTGREELLEGRVKEVVTGTAKGVTVLSAAGGMELKCSGATSVDETAEEAGFGTIKFTGCKEEPAASQCKTTGAAAGEIVEPISSKITSFSTKVTETGTAGALLLAPRNAANENALAFNCGGVNITVKGSVTGRFGSEGSAATKNTAEWALNESKEQELTDANPLKVKIGGGAEESATETGETSLETKEETVLLG
jgi:hypothetical protein